MIDNSGGIFAVFIEKPQVSDWADKLAGRPEPCLTKRAARR